MTADPILLPLAVGFVAGFGLALLTFGALWLALRGLAEGGSVRPGRFLLGFALRLALALAGFGLVLRFLGPGFGPLLTALLGFLAGRLVLTRTLGRRDGKGVSAPWS